MRHEQDNGGGSRRRHVRRALVVAGGVLADVIPLWLRGYRFGGNVVVRCRRGHVFTTIWVPAASVKALRLGLWRLQWCPVGRHWSLVTPVRQSQLTAGERQTAAATRDIRLP